MLRCVLLAAALALPSLPTVSQVQRNFPANAFRGEVVFGQPPEVQLNGQPARLAPAARIRHRNNMIVTSGSVVGEKLLVHYTLETTTGLVKEVWVLTDSEAARKPWPRDAKEAQSLRFDALAQTWSKP
jgi:hypothetical protein